MSVVEMEAEPQPEQERKHSHYFKFCPYQEVDPYAVLEMFEVTDQMLGHSIKKLLMAGQRGAKGKEKDIDEAIDTLLRRKEMKRIRAAKLALMEEGYK